MTATTTPMSTNAGYGALFRHRAYRRLWTANGVSLIGDGITRVALPVVVYQRTGSAAALGGTVLLQTLAQSLVGLVCGVAVDRYPRKMILVVTPLVQAALIAMLTIVPALWQILALTFASSGLTILMSTARVATLPDLVGPALMPYAAASGQVSWQAMNIIGPGLGGVLVARIGPRAAFLCDSASFVAIAALVATIAIPHATPLGERLPPLADMLTGFRYIAARPAICFLVFGDLACDIGYTVLLVLTVTLAERVLRRGSAVFGLLLATHAAAFVVSALVATRIATRTGRVRAFFVAGPLVASAGLLVAAFWATLPGAFLGWALLGTGTAPGWTLGGILWAKVVPSALRGRTTAVASAAASLAQLVAAAAIGGAAGAFGTRATIGGAGGVQIAVALGSIALFWRGFQALREV